MRKELSNNKKKKQGNKKRVNEQINKRYAKLQSTRIAPEMKKKQKRHE